MPRYQTNRQAILRRYRKPYKRMYPKLSRGRAIISQARVGGAQSRMTSGMPPPPEIKTADTFIASTTVNPNYTRYSPEAVLAGITVGAGSNQRIGRKIRVVGIVLRLEVGNNTPSPAVTALYPWTFDLMWDKQPNGASPIATNFPYAPDSSGAFPRNSLPNPNYTQRYQFIKRVQSSVSQSVGVSTIDYTIKCDKLISYDGNAGTLADLETNNLLLFGAVTSPASTGLIVVGNIRILFVDA